MSLMRRNMMAQSSQERKLPDEYQEVEYIHTDGNQYIDLGYLINTYQVFEFKLSADVHTSYKGSAIFGARYNFTTKNIALWSEADTMYKMRNFYSSNTATSFDYDITGGDYVIVKTRRKLYINNELVSDAGNNDVPVSSTSVNAFLFDCSNNGKAMGYRSKGNFYYMKVTEDDGSVSHKLKPCYRKSDNVIGLYDIVTDVFYTNIGTGNFTKGNDVL